LLQTSWFQIQYNAASAKFIELGLSLCWRTYTTLQSVTIIRPTNCKLTRFTKPRYIIVKIDLCKDNDCSTLIFILVCFLITFVINVIIAYRMVSRTQVKIAIIAPVFLPVLTWFYLVSRQQVAKSVANWPSQLLTA